MDPSSTFLSPNLPSSSSDPTGAEDLDFSVALGVSDDPSHDHDHDHDHHHNAHVQSPPNFGSPTFGNEDNMSGTGSGAGGSGSNPLAHPFSNTLYSYSTHSTTGHTGLGSGAGKGTGNGGASGSRNTGGSNGSVNSGTGGGGIMPDNDGPGGMSSHGHGGSQNRHNNQHQATSMNPMGLHQPPSQAQHGFNPSHFNNHNHSHPTHHPYPIDTHASRPSSSSSQIHPPNQSHPHSQPQTPSFSHNPHFSHQPQNGGFITHHPHLSGENGMGAGRPQHKHSYSDGFQSFGGTSNNFQGFSNNKQQQHGNGISPQAASFPASAISGIDQQINRGGQGQYGFGMSSGGMAGGSSMLLSGMDMSVGSQLQGDDDEDDDDEDILATSLDGSFNGVLQGGAGATGLDFDREMDLELELSRPHSGAHGEENSASVGLDDELDAMLGSGPLSAGLGGMGGGQGNMGTINMNVLNGHQGGSGGGYNGFGSSNHNNQAQAGPGPSSASYNPPKATYTAPPGLSVEKAQALDALLLKFWTEQMELAERGALAESGNGKSAAAPAAAGGDTTGPGGEFKHFALPLARIKKVMKSDPEVKMISAEVPVLLSKSCEIFIAELTSRAWLVAQSHKRRTLQKSDVAAAIGYSDMFDFLIDIVPREDPPVKGEGSKKKSAGTNAGHAHTAAGVSGVKKDELADRGSESSSAIGGEGEDAQSKKRKRAAEDEAKRTARPG